MKTKKNLNWMWIGLIMATLRVCFTILRYGNNTIYGFPVVTFSSMFFIFVETFILIIISVVIYNLLGGVIGK